MGVVAQCWGEPVLSRCGRGHRRGEPRPLAKGAGSECTPVEEVKPERVLSEDRERGTSEEKDPSLKLQEMLTGHIWDGEFGA